MSETGGRGDGFCCFFLREQKTVIYTVWWFRNPVNSPVEGKVVYFHCFARVFSTIQTVVVWDF